MRFHRGRVCCAVSLMMACGLRAHAQVPIPVPPAKVYPGWDLVAKAAGAYAADKGPKGSPDAGANDPNPVDDLARQRATIARNAAALEMIRAALAAGIVRPPAIDPAAEDIGKRRALTRLLAQEGRVRAADKDWPAAAQSALDSMDLFIQLPRGGVLIDALAGWGAESVGQRELRRLEPSLPPAVARASAVRLLHMDAARPTLAEAVRGDRAYSWLMIKEGFAEPNWANRAKEMGKYEDLPAEAREDISKADFETMRDLTEAEIEKEFNAHTELIAAWAQGQPSRDWRKGPVVPKARYMMTRLCDEFWQAPRVVFGAARIATNARLLAVQLAADAFHAEKNRWPATLGELVPEYLPAVPIDPFSGLPLRWKIKDGAPVLYSVGPDGADDGGKAIPTTAKDTGFVSPPGLPPRPVTDTGGRLVEESVGDVVFGVDR